MEYKLATIIILLIGVFEFVLFIYLLDISKKTLLWKTVSGKITYADIKKFNGTKSQSYKPIVKYKYTIEGKEFNSKRVFYGNYVNRSFLRNAKKVVQNYKSGTSVVVYYNPLKPSCSVLEPGVHSVIYKSLVIGIVFILISVLMMVKEAEIIQLFNMTE